MFQKKEYKIAFLFIAVLLGASLIQGLFIDITRDSGKYATVAKEIFMSNHWLSITVHGDPYLQKPPFMFWLSALSFHLFGLSNFSFKFPLLLFSLAGVYFTYRLGKSLYNKKTGIISAILLLFSEYFLLYTMDIHTDTLLMPLVVFSTWQLLDYTKSKRMINLTGAAIGVALGMLTKGPIGAALPAFAIGTHLLAKKQYKQIIDWHWLIFLAIILLIISPELWNLYQRFGIDGIKFYFWTNNVGRVTGQYLGTNHDYFFFFHTLLYMLLPWSLFFYIASFNELKRVIKKWSHTPEFYTIGGTWIFLIIMSISRSKLPNYIYALTPMMAITTAKWIYYTIRTKNNTLQQLLKYSQTSTEIIIWVLILLITTYLFPLKNMICLSVIILLFLSYLYFKRKKESGFSLINSILAMLCLVFVLNFHLFPEVYSQQAIPRAARIFNKESTSEEKLYNYSYSQYELYFYGKGTVQLIKDESELTQIMQKGKSWIFTDRKGFQEIEKKATDFPCDSIIPLTHTSLKKGFRYINPKTREKTKGTMYLLHFK